ncbi:MAG: FixH family protein [Sulfurospirillum sp.]|nr:FixH family protein [Sulfurospirillum sp.]
MSKSSKLESNYWPHAIITMILLTIGACAWTIQIALDNPVEMDSFYLEKHQSVERNINEINANQEKFDANYAIKHESVKFSMNQENSVIFSIIDKSGKVVENAKIRLMISRPETNKFNQEFTLEKATNGKYSVNGIQAIKPGRWQVLTRISLDGIEAFNKYEVFAN